MELREVAPQVYAVLNEDRGWGWSNTGLVDRGGGLMVDTLMDVPHTRRALELLGTRAAVPPRRLVNTHHNADHCWGNQLLRGAEIWGHRRCAEAMRRDAGPEALRRALARPDLPPGLRWFADDVADFDFSGIEVTPPEHVFEGDRELDLGGTRAELLDVSPAHTAGDVVVHLPEEGVVFAGDVLFRRCTPIGWEGTFARWIDALDRIAALDPEAIVPGHGPVCGAAGALELRDYLVYVAEAASHGFDRGLSLLETAKRIELGPFAAWTQPERLVFNVARARRERAGGAWDEPVDVAALLDAAVALRSHWEARGGVVPPA